MYDVAHDLYTIYSFSSCHTFYDPFPWSVTYYMNGPYGIAIQLAEFRELSLNCFFLTSHYISELSAYVQH